MTPAAVRNARARRAGWWPRANANPTITAEATTPRRIHLMPVTLYPPPDNVQAHFFGVFHGKRKKAPSPSPSERRGQGWGLGSC